MKKSLRLALLAGASAAALSVAPLADAEAQSAFDGFYAGLGVGYHHFNADDLSNDFIACCTSNTSFPQKSQSGDGPIVGIFGGYGDSHGPFYVGAEAEFTYSGASKSFTAFTPEGQAEGHAKIRAKDGYGLSARFGYLITPDLLGFVRLGMEWQRFSGSFQTIVLCPGCFADQPNMNSDAMAFGGRVGVGGDYLVAPLSGGQQIFVRLEYDHTFYGNVRIGQNGPLLCCSTNVGNTTLNFNPSDDIVRVAAGIRF